jgi:hypothetical protein
MMNIDNEKVIVGKMVSEIYKKYVIENGPVNDKNLKLKIISTIKKDVEAKLFTT